MTEALPTTVGVWEAQDTTVDAVVQQLAQTMSVLARAAEGNGATRPAPPVTRASVLNLVVHADEAGEAEQAADLMATLAIRHPSRTILLVAEPNAPADGLDAAIRTRCLAPPGLEGHLCFEEVRLVARGTAAFHLASIAEPLLITNLPVFLWWLGSPPESQDPLIDLCDRLIVDSADFPEGAAGLASLDACTTETAGLVELGDLGWRRGAPCRQIVAQFFDPADARGYQRRISAVTVDYRATPSGRPGAAPLLLVGWLATRLGWEPSAVSRAGAALDLTFETDFAEATPSAVSVRLRACPPDAASAAADPAQPGDVLAVALTATGGTSRDAAAARFELTWDANRTTATTCVVLPGGREATRHAPLERPPTTELLAREIGLPAADPVYAESLAMVARLVR